MTTEPSVYSETILVVVRRIRIVVRRRRIVADKPAEAGYQERSSVQWPGALPARTMMPAGTTMPAAARDSGTVRALTMRTHGTRTRRAHTRTTRTHGTRTTRTHTTRTPHPWDPDHPGPYYQEHLGPWDPDRPDPPDPCHRHQVHPVVARARPYQAPGPTRLRQLACFNGFLPWLPRCATQRITFVLFDDNRNRRGPDRGI